MPGYPEAPRLDVADHRHGRCVPDPYRWLEDAADPRTGRWSAAQAEIYAAERARWRDRERWHARLTTLVAADRVLTPKARGDRMFVRRLGAGEDHPTLFVLEDGAERPLLDPLALDPGGRTVVEAWEPSIEGDLVAYQLSRDGAEDSELWVLDVVTGAVVDGPIDRLRRTSVGWLPGGNAFYYVRRLPGEERYHRRVYLHRVGTDPAGDALVFGDGRDRTRFYSVAVTPDGRWLTVVTTTGAAPDTDVYLADLSAGPATRPAFTPVQEGAGARTRPHLVAGTGPHDTIWLRTDRDAPRGRLVACSPADPRAWREVVGERPDAVLTDLAVLGGEALGRPVGLVTWTRHAVAEVTVHDLASGRRLGTVPLPGDGVISGFSVRPEGGNDAWFLYTDHVTPGRLLHYDARTGEVRPWPSAARGRTYGVATSRAACASRDGTTVRMFVVSPTGVPDRPRPAILTGYGGFGASMSPAFSPQAVAWAQAGGVYVAACLRGGGEEGEEWHRAGRGANKRNVFDDFDAVTDHLIRAGWTSADRLTVMGSSNGGLLVAAAITRHPAKYAAAVCMAPLLDMVRYELSGMGPSWVPEYGSADDPEQFRTLLSYSPYHHVEPGVAYPAVLLAAFEGDTRVDPLHARKMCAALQHASRGRGPVLLRLEAGVGHGTRAMSRELALYAECLAFLAEQAGLGSGP
jgi:prolyl oligopeptidase